MITRAQWNPPDLWLAFLLEVRIRVDAPATNGVSPLTRFVDRHLAGPEWRRHAVADMKVGDVHGEQSDNSAPEQMKRPAKSPPRRKILISVG